MNRATSTANSPRWNRYLRTQPAGKKKREVVEHFQPLYDKSAVYRELKKLVTAGQVLECIGIVTAVSEVRNGAK